MLVRDSMGVAVLQVHMHMLQLRGISTMDQTFDCTIMCHVRWYETSSGDDWGPQLSFTNAVEDLRVHLSETRRVSVSNTLVHACMTLLASGTFAEVFELRQFPVDIQRLHVHVSMLNCPMWKGAGASAAMHHEDRPSMASVMYGQRFRLKCGDVSMDDDGFMEDGSWEMVDDMNMVRGRTNTGNHPDGLAFCKVIVHVTVQRKPIYHFWNAVFPVALQVVLAFVTCYVDALEMGTKAQITVTIILTIFAIRFSIAQSMPAVSCLTYLDAYFVMSTFWACAVVGQNMLVYHIAEKDGRQVEITNMVSGSILIGLWMAANLVVFTAMWSERIRKAISRDMVELLDLQEEQDIQTRMHSAPNSPVTNPLFWPRHSASVDSVIEGLRKSPPSRIIFDENDHTGSRGAFSSIAVRHMGFDDEV